MAKKLYRSEQHKMIGGVCGGLGEYFELDVTLTRLIFVAVGLLTAVFPMALFYIIAWIIVPVQQKSE
jgi:phage shock protein C